MLWSLAGDVVSFDPSGRCPPEGAGRVEIEVWPRSAHCVVCVCVCWCVLGGPKQLKLPKSKTNYCNQKQKETKAFDHGLRKRKTKSKVGSPSVPPSVHRRINAGSSVIGELGRNSPYSPTIALNI